MNDPLNLLNVPKSLEELKLEYLTAMDKLAWIDEVSVEDFVSIFSYVNELEERSK